MGIGPRPPACVSRGEAAAKLPRPRPQSVCCAAVSPEGSRTLLILFLAFAGQHSAAPARAPAPALGLLGGAQQFELPS